MPEFYESTEAAGKAIGVSRQTIARWIRENRLKAEPFPRAGVGRPGSRIRHDDLMAASRGAIFEADPVQTQLPDISGHQQSPLGLQVIWPWERRSQPFSPDLLAGHARFRAVTYTVSIPAILRLLATNDYESFEVIFGCEELVYAEATKVIALQKAIEDELTKGFVGVGGDSDPKLQALLERQVAGQARFLVMSGSIVHSKIYLLESPGNRRALVGSANLSNTALSGRQGEVLLCFDNDDYMWNELESVYEGLRSLATTSLQVKPEMQPAQIVSVDDFPVARNVEKDNGPVTIFVPEPSDLPGNPVQVGIRAEDLMQVVGPAFRQTLKTTTPGVVEITPAQVRVVSRAVSSAKPVNREDLLHKLTYVADQGGQEGRFLYDGRLVERSESQHGIQHDSVLITQYLNNYQEFGATHEILQRNYFAVMGWLYFSPFMGRLVREREALGPGNFDCKRVAILYGPASCGKTDFVKLLLTSMFGPPKPLTDKDFTPIKVFPHQVAAGLYPLFYDDIKPTRFTAGRRGGDTAGDSIVKEYDNLHHQLAEFPCLIASLNEAARDFGPEVWKRALMIFTNTPLAGDDGALRTRLEARAKLIHREMDRGRQGLYAEYLYRMERHFNQVSEWASFDYLLESTGLLVQLFRENLPPEEPLPKWCQQMSSSDLDHSSWELKRNQMKSRLDRALYTKEFPPPEGRWTVKGEDIVVGVESWTVSMSSKEFPDFIINRETSNAGCLHLGFTVTVEFLNRGEVKYTLPIPKGPFSMVKGLVGRK